MVVDAWAAELGADFGLAGRDILVVFGTADDWLEGANRIQKSRLKSHWSMLGQRLLELDPVFEGWLVNAAEAEPQHTSGSRMHRHYWPLLSRLESLDSCIATVVGTDAL